MRRARIARSPPRRRRGRRRSRRSRRRASIATGANLRARVNPRGLATTVRFEYGPTTAYGNVTPEQAIGAGTSTVLGRGRDRRPGAEHALPVPRRGDERGGRRRAARTARSRRSRVPTGVAITPSTIRPVWGSGLTITGTVSGVNSTPVALEKQDFPYSGPFVADRDGDREQPRRVHAHGAAAVHDRAPARRDAHRGRRHEPGDHRLRGGQGGAEERGACQAGDTAWKAQSGRPCPTAGCRFSANRAAVAGAP